MFFLLLIRKQRAQKVSASFSKYINCKSITFYNILKTYWLYRRRTVNHLFRIFWTRSCSNIHIKGQLKFLNWVIYKQFSDCVMSIAERFSEALQWKSISNIHIEMFRALQLGHFSANSLSERFCKKNQVQSKIPRWFTYNRLSEPFSPIGDWLSKEILWKSTFVINLGIFRALETLTEPFAPM